MFCILFSLTDLLKETFNFSLSFDFQGALLQYLKWNISVIAAWFVLIED